MPAFMSGQKGQSTAVVTLASALAPASPYLPKERAFVSVARALSLHRLGETNRDGAHRLLRLRQEKEFAGFVPGIFQRRVLRILVHL